MEGQYIPFSDDYGIIGFNYLCPKCEHENLLQDCDDGCKECGFKESYTEPCRWYDNEMNKTLENRSWNLKKTK